MEYLGKRSVASFLRTVLTVLWWFGIAGCVAFLAIAILLMIFGPPNGIKPPVFSINDDFIRVEFSSAVVKDPMALLRAFLPFGAVMIGIGMGILFQLKKIFAMLAEGNPFTMDIAKRMKKISLFIFGGVITEFIAGTVIGRIIVENVRVDGVVFGVEGSLNLGGIFVGLIFLILAEIFRQGTLLKEEQELTI